MNRNELTQFIKKYYNIEPDNPWQKYPNYRVFRHNGNNKWFALIMDIPKQKIGLRGTDIIDVVNLKCDPALIGSLLAEPGFFPAYHMNKGCWITVALNGKAEDDMIKVLLDMSYVATAPKKP